MLWAYLTLPGLWILYGSLWILLVAYIIKGLPLGVRALSGTMIQVHQELEDCARVHGASWLRTLWSIVLRLIRPGIMAGGIFFVYIAIRDLSTPILLYGFGTEVLSIVLLQFWAEKQPQVVSVLAIIMLAVLTAFSAIQRLLLLEKERPETVEGELPIELVRRETTARGQAPF
jgi:iron(III) transport system permease protein